MVASSNAELFSLYARPGMVGLAGGSAWVDRTIRRVQMPWRSPNSCWSHAFICSGKRIDGAHWVLESDLEIRHKQIRLGVQENRAAKYFDAALYPNLALLDFSLSDAQTQAVMCAGLDLLAGSTRYAVRELLGTLLALQRPALRGRENLLAREGALYCSAMVQHCYAAIGLQFSAGVATKNITPEDLATTALAHVRHALVRSEAC